MSTTHRLIAGGLLLAAGVALYLVGPAAARELATLLAGSSIPILGPAARNAPAAAASRIMSAVVK